MHYLGHQREQRFDFLNPTPGQQGRNGAIAVNALKGPTVQHQRLLGRHVQNGMPFVPRGHVELAKKRRFKGENGNQNVHMGAQCVHTLGLPSPRRGGNVLNDFTSLLSVPRQRQTFGQLGIKRLEINQNNQIRIPFQHRLHRGAQQPQHARQGAQDLHKTHDGQLLQIHFRRFSCSLRQGRAAPKTNINRWILQTPRFYPTCSVGIPRRFSRQDKQFEGLYRYSHRQ